jgi:hypothetical protein
MIVCQKCGTENANSAKFCKNPACQSFLEWEGEAVQTTQQPAVRSGGDPVGSTARPGVATPRAGEGDATQPGTDPQDLLAKPSAAGRGVRNPGQPSAVKPAEAKQRPVETRRSSGAGRDAGDGPPALKPGQSACPNCGWPVEASWNFCHHCSTSLSLPRVGPAGPSPDRTSRWYSAGERPFRGGGGGRGVRILAVLASVIALAGIGLAASRFLPGDKAKSAAATTTSSTEPPGVVALKGVKLIDTETESGSHVGALVIDGNLDTFWSRNANGDSTPHLTFDFGRTVKLTRVEIASGAAGDEFAKRPRPKSLRVVFGDDFQLTFTLKDQREVQTIDFDPHATRRFRVVVQSTYPGSDPAPNGQRTSIRELRFFAQAQDQG